MTSEEGEVRELRVFFMYEDQKEITLIYTDWNMENLKEEAAKVFPLIVSKDEIIFGFKLKKHDVEIRSVSHIRENDIIEIQILPPPPGLEDADVQESNTVKIEPGMDVDMKDTSPPMESKLERVRFLLPYKLKMCTFVHAEHGCRNGINCTFAHSRRELLYYNWRRDSTKITYCRNESCSDWNCKFMHSYEEYLNFCMDIINNITF